MAAGAGPLVVVGADRMQAEAEHELGRDAGQHQAEQVRGLQRGQEGAREVRAGHRRVGDRGVVGEGAADAEIGIVGQPQAAAGQELGPGAEGALQRESGQNLADAHERRHVAVAQLDDVQQRLALAAVGQGAGVVRLLVAHGLGAEAGAAGQRRQETNGGPPQVVARTGRVVDLSWHPCSISSRQAISAVPELPLAQERGARTPSAATWGPRRSTDDDTLGHRDRARRDAAADRGRGRTPGRAGFGADALRPPHREARPRLDRRAQGSTGRPAGAGHGDHADAGRRGQDHDHGGPRRRAQPDRQARGDRLARALARPLLRHEGRRRRRRLRAGRADGADQPALHRRLPRHRQRAQPAGGDARQPHLLGQRAGPRRAAHRLAPGDRHERPLPCARSSPAWAGSPTASRARTASTSPWPRR